MYKMNKKLLDRTNLNRQTMSNNANPQMITLLQRASLPITSSRYWEVLDCGGTVLSAAVKRPTVGQLASEVWRAVLQSDGSVKIQRAAVKSKLINMVWNDAAELNTAGVTTVLLQFDGKAVTRRGMKENITVGESPYIIAAGMADRSDIYKIENGKCVYICSFAPAAAVSSVRGEYGAAVNDGILIFYIDTEGKLHEVSFKNDTIVYDSMIDLYPEGVTAWKDVRANTTFDYRIVLQLQTADNQVYSLFSQSRTGGEMVNENIDVTVKATGKIAVNKFLNVTDVRYNAGAVYVTFDENITFEGQTDVSVWTVTDYAGRIIPFSTVEKYGDNMIVLKSNGDRLAEDVAMPYTLHCTGAEYIVNDAGNGIEPFDFKFINGDYWRGHTTEHIYASVSAKGGIIPLVYISGAAAENISVSNVSCRGKYVDVTYSDVYSENEYITANVTGKGNIYSTSDVPV